MTIFGLDCACKRDGDPLAERTRPPLLRLAYPGRYPPELYAGGGSGTIVPQLVNSRSVSIRKCDSTVCRSAWNRSSG